MIRIILNLYCLFIDYWKHFIKLFELFIKVVGAGTSFEVFGILSDWTQHRLCNIKTICNVFCIWYLAWLALLMKSSWTVCTQYLVTVTAVLSSWIRTGLVFTVKSMWVSTCISCIILHLNYLSVICWELWYCSIFNKIIIWLVSVL